MKQDIHPTWYQAQVRCTTCDTRWVTGATVESLTVEICSNCHPFYTGEQRIVDTEGRVDKFLKRSERTVEMRSSETEDVEEKAPLDLPIAELELSTRYVNILTENNINVVGDVLTRLGEDDDENSILAIQGIGRKVLSDLKKMLRAEGYEIEN
jgi:large subunit ribosomal protein L31